MDGIPGVQSSLLKLLRFVTLIFNVIFTTQSYSLSWKLDKKFLTQANITVEQTDKTQKIMPHCSALFDVSFATRKNAKFGKQRYGQN